MPQTGYTPILIYASGTATNTPSAANLTSSASGAELALNYADGKLYYKDNGGVVQLLASKASATGTVSSVAQSFTGGLISVSGSPITTSGTLALTVAGTSGGVPYFSSASTWASSAALTANALMIGGGAGAAPATTTTGTGVITALGVNTGTSGAFVVNGGALGTPTSGTLTNTTGLPLSTGVTGTLAEANGGTGTTTGYYGFKNRIINGAMMIDQRNSGASVTPANSYTLDRWYCSNTQSSKFTVQQNAGSVTTQAGFPNYLGATSSSAYSVVAGDAFTILQSIEGFNVADLAFGTSSAATVTVSFWVRSSLTGTFGGSLRNYAATRSYPFTYTISSANTWEQKSITIAGDTSGTWVGASSNGSMILTFSLGAGSTFSGTASAWASANYISATGATSVVGTNGATFYITGVQLEKGSTATSFDYRPYGTELALCQRYYYKWLNDFAGNAFPFTLQAYASTAAYGKLLDFPVFMRATPTVSTSGTFTGADATGTATTAFTTLNCRANISGIYATTWSGSSGMVAGNATGPYVSQNAYITASAEL